MTTVQIKRPFWKLAGEFPATWKELSQSQYVALCQILLGYSSTHSQQLQILILFFRVQWYTLWRSIKVSRLWPEELEALRNAPAPEVPTVDTGALDTLGAEIDALRSEAAATQAALREELEERARQIQRLQNDLELARLETPRRPAPTGPTAEELRLQELERRRQAELRLCVRGIG